MSEHHGAKLLYRAATGLEKALADVDGERLTALYAEAVADVWDPWAISRENLPVLAWAMQARLWEDEWAEHTKREWTANQWHFQALRGTQAGVEMALTNDRPGLYRRIQPARGAGPASGLLRLALDDQGRMGRLGSPDAGAAHSTRARRRPFG